jgi:hypothetical protein
MRFIFCGGYVSSVINFMLICSISYESVQWQFEILLQKNAQILPM